MNIGQIITEDIANGPGLRVSVFVSGCRNHCPGCFQPETWDFNYGVKYTDEIENMIIAKLKEGFYSGITILGGEPLDPKNQKTVLQLIKRVNRECTEKTIWVYTGYSYEEFLEGGRGYTEYIDEILDRIHVLVDGRFMKDLKRLDLKFRGSSNQRIINMGETRKTGEIHLVDL